VRIVCYPLTVPGAPLVGVLGTLTLGATQDGLVTVGHSLMDLTTLEQISLGASAPVQQQDAAGLASDVLRQLLEAQASLLDWPPFP